MHNEFKLISEIVARSVADTWEDAKTEWSLKDVSYADKVAPGTCLCGKFPIIENCVLVNRINGNEAIVGNVCVKKFLGLESDQIFTAINRVRQNLDGALNAATVEHAHERGWMNDWERKFYFDTFRKRKLSGKQRAKRAEINEKVLTFVGS